ncbi:hypothetical protein ACE1OE_23645 [Vibrio sp. E150_011]
MYEREKLNSHRYSLLVEQMIQAHGYYDWMIGCDSNEYERAQQTIERIAGKFWVLGQEAHGEQFDLRLLTQAQAEEIVNVIVFSGCGETKLILNDLTLFMLILNVFFKHTAYGEPELQMESEPYRELQLSDEHIYELWPWDRVFISN